MLDEPNELIDCRKRRFLLPGATGPVSTESAVFLEARGHLLHRQASERFQDGSSAIVPKLNEWLAGLFSPENFDMTCKQLAAAGDPDEGAAGRQEAARR